MNINENKFKTWNDVEKELFTPEEIAESKLRVELIGALISAQKDKDLYNDDCKVNDEIENIKL